MNEVLWCKHGCLLNILKLKCAIQSLLIEFIKFFYKVNHENAHLVHC
jgi:hypothetical protein